MAKIRVVIQKPVQSVANNIEGGSPSNIYLISQVINGGNP